MKLIPTLLIGWIVFGFIQDASAFSCMTITAGSTRVTVNAINATAPCAIGQQTLLSPVEFAAFQQMQLDVAALQSSPGVTATTFDPVLAGQLWMFALTIIVGCWLLAKNAGLILEAIRRW